MADQITKEEEARRREEDECIKKEQGEYVKATVAFVLAGFVIVLCALPVVFLVVGVSVRLYRWAAGS